MIWDSSACWLFLIPRRGQACWKRGPPHKPWFPHRTSRWDDFLNHPARRETGPVTCHPPPSKGSRTLTDAIEGRLHRKPSVRIRKGLLDFYYSRMTTQSQLHLIVSNSMTIICDLNLLETCFLNLNDNLTRTSVNMAFSTSSLTTPAGRSITHAIWFASTSGNSTIWDIFQPFCIYFPRNWLVLLYHISRQDRKASAT